MVDMELKNTLTIEMRLDADLVGTELGDTILKEFQSLANPNFPMVNTGIEIAQNPKFNEFYLNCVNQPQSKIDSVMTSIAKLLEEVA